jgi:hypothetical protein
MPNPHEKEQRPGIAVDAKGGNVVDPTANVIALNQASDRRQDDLRAAHEKLMETELRHVKEMIILRAECAKELRLWDVTSVKAESERAREALQTLAAHKASDWDKLRTDMNTTAQIVAKQTSEVVGQLNERIAALERSSYEGKGKEAVADPMLARLYAEMKTMNAYADTTTGKGRGLNAMWGYVAGAIGLIISILSAFGIVLSMRGK